MARAAPTLTLSPTPTLALLVPLTQGALGDGEDDDDDDVELPGGEEGRRRERCLEECARHDRRRSRSAAPASVLEPPVGQGGLEAERAD